MSWMVDCQSLVRRQARVVKVRWLALQVEYSTGSGFCQEGTFVIFLGK
jgi:hypothetical protein